MNKSDSPARTQAEAATAGSTASALAIIGRIEEAIVAETAAIRSNPDFDLKASNARKSRYLHELNKALRGISEGELRTEHRDALASLRDKLAANEATIKAHLNAVGEVAGMLQRAIERSQADGTYSVREFGRAASA